MKKFIMGVFFALTISGVQAQSTIKTSAQEVTPELVQQREASKQLIITKYLALNQSLIVSDSVQAGKSAAELVTALNQFKFKKLSLSDMNTATTMRVKLIGLAKEIADTQSINKQRSSMMQLSEGLWTIIDKVVPAKTILYKQTCPMTGKVWISGVKEIQNPYYPKNMLTCGEVTASAGAVQP